MKQMNQVLANAAVFKQNFPVLTTGLREMERAAGFLWAGQGREWGAARWRRRSLRIWPAWENGRVVLQHTRQP